MLLFFTSKQHAARPLPAAHTERKSDGKRHKRSPPPSAMQEKLLLKHEAPDLVNILRFQCPVMSLRSGSNDDLILLHTSLDRPGANEAVLWVGEATPEEELVKKD